MNHEIRLDVWLDVACLFKTRSEAKRACEGGKVDVNGQTARPNRLIRGRTSASGIVRDACFSATLMM